MLMHSVPTTRALPMSVGGGGGILGIVGSALLPAEGSVVGDDEMWTVGGDDGADSGCLVGRSIGCSVGGAVRVGPSDGAVVRSSLPKI